MIMCLSGEANRELTAIKQSRLLSSLGVKHVLVLTGCDYSQDHLTQVKKEILDSSVEVILDARPTRTLEHFTEGKDLVRKYKPTRLYVVTNDWHLPRAVSLAKMTYLGWGLSVIGVPHKGSNRKDPGSVYLETLEALLKRVVCP